MRPIALVALLAPIVFGSLAPAARADTLCLKDGRVLENLTLTRDQDAILVKFKNGDVRIPNALVEEALLASDAEDAAKNSDVAKRLEARKKYVEQMKALSEWRNRKKETTKHFDFESTVPPNVYASYRDRMEVYFTEFAKMWNIKQPKEGRLAVCFYGNRDTFHQVTAMSRGVLGYFKPVKPWELDIYYDRLDPVLTEAVMFHESNHYLQKLLNVQARMPHFPGESLAEYYGASKWDDKAKKLTVGLVQEGRLAEVKTDIDGGKMLGLEEMLSSGDMYEHYTWGWTLVHFLMNQEKYAKKFQRYVTTLVTGNDVKRVPFGFDGIMAVDDGEVLRVFMKCLDLKNKDALKALESEWHAYVKNELKAVTPRGMEEAGLRVFSDWPPRPIKAKNLLQKAIDAGSTNSNAYDKLAFLYASEDQNFEKAIPLWRKAIALDPLTAQYYANLGHALTMKGQKDEGAKLVALAVELDPDDPYLEMLDYRDK